MKNKFYNWMIQYLLTRTALTVSTLVEMKIKVEKDPRTESLWKVYQTVEEI